MDAKISIGERLKELRKQKRLTLKQVGEHLQLTSAAISCYENGTRKPSHEVIQRLADLYETTADDIIGIQNDSSNMRTILNNNKLHWDGILLEEEELMIIKQILEMRAKDRARDCEKNKMEAHDKRRHG